MVIVADNCPHIPSTTLSGTTRRQAGSMRSPTLRPSPRPCRCNRRVQCAHASGGAGGIAPHRANHRQEICPGLHERHAVRRGDAADRAASQHHLAAVVQPALVSDQVAPALKLGFARFGQLEVAGLDLAGGLVVRHDHPGRIRL